VKQKVQPIRSPTLFEMGKLDKAADLMSSLQVLRPYSEPDLYLGSIYPTTPKLSEPLKYAETCGCIHFG
jgi:hypothetical protein